MLTRNEQRFDHFKSGVRLLALAGLLASYIAGLLPMSAMAAPIAQSATAISGKVYRDLNSDGQLAITETGMAGVTVTAYDSAGAVAGTAQVTNATGDYTISNLVGAGPFRVEFTNLPVGYKPATRGSGNGTSTQFVGAPASSVNFAINQPCDYCNSAPQLVEPVYERGAPETASSTPGTIIRWAYDATQRPTLTTIAARSSVGSVWGLAHDRNTDTLYSAAFLKRSAGLKEKDPATGAAISNPLGAIFKTNGASGATQTSSLFFDVSTVPGVNVGTIPTNALRPVTGTDLESYNKVGKVGLGDIDISSDGSTLWTVSLNDKQLLSIPTTNPNASNVGHYPIPNPGCRAGSGDYRPFATAYYLEKVYVGMVCDGELSQLNGDLSAAVYRFDPQNPAAGFSSVLSFPLSYVKGKVNTAANCPASHDRWFAWVGTAQGNLPPGYCYGLPQPILSDIEFDLDGSMILGFTDRMGHQGAPPAATTAVFGGGDTLRAYNNNGNYVLESNGVVGPLTSGTPNNQGPGGSEFYKGDTSAPALLEATLGGLAIVAERGEVVSTNWDPLSYNSRTGTVMLSNANGSSRKIQELAQSSFGKANGAGDLEVLCDPAPIEIGNRVWNDANRNGIQDANEAGISGVQVQLSRPDGTVLGTTTTDFNGNYYFRSEGTTGAYATTLRPNTSYVVSINPSQAFLSGLAPTTANAEAISGSPTSNDAILDTRDSDATVVNGVATINYTTGSAGMNNHGLDFGFAPPAPTATPTNTPVPATATPTPNPLGAIGNQVWNDLNGNGIQDSGEPYVQGVKVELLSGCSGTTILGTRTTDTSGYYNFPGLTAGQYRVRFTLPTGYQFTAKNQGTRTTHDSNANADGVTDCITLAAGQLDGTIDAGLVVSSAPTATPTNTPVPATATPTLAPVSAADLSITKSASVSSVISGVPFNYILTVVNNGPGTANSVVVTDQLPAGLAINSVVPTAGGSCSNTAGLIRCTWASLANGASATVTINVTP